MQASTILKAISWQYFPLNGYDPYLVWIAIVRSSVHQSNKMIANKSMNITLNSRPPHFPHRAQPCLLQYTSAYLHQQQIELLNPETLKVNHKDQDQPEKTADVKIMKNAFSLYLKVNASS